MFTSLKIGPERCQVVGYKASLICAFLWSYYWNHPFTHAVSGIYGRQALPRRVLFQFSYRQTKFRRNYFINFCFFAHFVSLQCIHFMDRKQFSTLKQFFGSHAFFVENERNSRYRWFDNRIRFTAIKPMKDRSMLSTQSQ